MQQWIIGVLLAALASIISNFGLNLQKLCHIRNEKNQTNNVSASELSSVPLRRKRRRLRPLKKQRETPLLQDATASDTSTQIQIISPHGNITPINAHANGNGNGNGNGTTPRTSVIGRTPMNGQHPPGLTPTNLDGDRHYSQSITSSSSFALQINDDDFTSPSFNVALNDTPTAMRAGAGRGSMSMPPNIVPATPASALSAMAEAVHGSHPHPSSTHSLASADPSNLVPSPSFVTVEPRKVNYVKQPLWQLGLAAVIGGSLLDFIALGFAAQSVIAPLGSLTLVSNSFFAPILLKEKISKRDMAATAAIVAGSCISVIFASHQESTITVSELFDHFESTRFIVYGIWLL